MGSGSLSTSGFVKWYTVVEPLPFPPADSLGRHRSDETVETERLRNTTRVAGFSTVSDTTTERTGSNTRIIIATLQTTREGRKGVKHPLILSPRKHATRHTEHRFTARSEGIYSMLVARKRADRTWDRMAQLQHPTIAPKSAG
eukprot:3895995-Prymnesium_polylepis.2